tara:strand:- start:364 stop:705 length:342 start_codon:yes stop_codon:yes gene_type:complete
MASSIPVSRGLPAQKFNIDFTLDGETDTTEHTLRLAWNTRALFMTMSIERDDVVLLSGLALKVGVDLFAPYPWLKLGKLIVTDLTNTGLELDYRDAGDNVTIVKYELGEEEIA